MESKLEKMDDQDDIHIAHEKYKILMIHVSFELKRF